MTRITIIGLGLIGGSMARDLRSQMNVHVTGVDSNPLHLEKAKNMQLVHEVAPLNLALKDAEIIILAIPVHAIQDLLPTILTQIKEDQVVIDVGSTKEEICKTVVDHSHRGRFVAAHPLSGTEFSGPEAAIRGLFVDKKNIICDKNLSDENALAKAMSLFESLGMETYYLNSRDHDKHLAYVSHLSHISSFTLSLTVLDIEKDESQIFNLASTGFESTARLAGSSPDTWTPIFEKNSVHLLEALDNYMNHLEKFKQAIISKNTTTLHSLMKEANDIRRVLKK